MIRPTPESLKTKSLHGLRGLLAWWVVLGHIAATFAWHLPLIESNVLAVDLFMMLSGFVIAMLINTKQETYSDYIIRRFFRLFPLYLFVLIISAFSLPIQLEAWQSVAEYRSNFLRVGIVLQAINDLTTHFLIHLLLLQTAVPNFFGLKSSFTLVGQAWSISLEWQFYIVAPLLFHLGVARTVLPKALGILLVVSLLLISRGFPAGFLGAHILTFIIGMATYLSAVKQHKLGWLWVSLIAAAGTIAIHGAEKAIPLAIWGVVTVATLRPADRWRRQLNLALGSPIPMRMGELSYSIYLNHMIVLFSLLWIGAAFDLDGWRLQIVVAMGTIVLTWFMSELTYRLIEQPGINFGARITARAAVPTDGNSAEADWKNPV